MLKVSLLALTDQSRQQDKQSPKLTSRNRGQADHTNPTVQSRQDSLGTDTPVLFKNSLFVFLKRKKKEKKIRITIIYENLQVHVTPLTLVLFFT